MIILAVVFGTLLLIPAGIFLSIAFVNIMLADTILLSILAVFLLRGVFHIHPGFCILGGALVFVLMTLLYMKEKWFSVFEWGSMLSWGYLASFLVHQLTGDRTWTWLIGMTVCTLNYLLHEYTKRRMQAG